MTRILFILKKRPAGPYDSWSYTTDGRMLPSGLSISATQMAYALDDLGIENKLVQVIDNNCIDREVTAYKPTHVIIEAFWVVPEKFDILRKLHPTVRWIVRNHSKSDFLAHEGGMIGWAVDYIRNGITLACNSPEATVDFQRVAIAAGADPKYVIYLPNFYRVEPSDTGLPSMLWKALRYFRIYGKPPERTGVMNVGCFGAVRPLKNHMHQAMAAIIVADKLGLKLKFHINGNRIEGKAESIIWALRALFKRFPQHELIELGWLAHKEFTEVVHTMDVVMQVSNSETFNIVSADAVAHGVPVLVSDEIPWLDGEYHANPNDVHDISHRLMNLYLGSGNGMLQSDQRNQLHKYADRSTWIWGQYLLGSDA
jgi:hypothetical protein